MMKILDLVSDMWVSDLVSMGYEDAPVIPSVVAKDEPCIGSDALRGVYFHPSNFDKPVQKSRQGRVRTYISGVLDQCLSMSFSGTD